LDWIVRQYKDATGEQELEAALFLEWLRAEEEYLMETPIGFFKGIRVSERDIFELDRFIQLRLARTNE